MYGSLADAILSMTGCRVAKLQSHPPHCTQYSVYHVGSEEPSYHHGNSLTQLRSEAPVMIWSLLGRL
jgi:hypothetical protein